MSGVLEQLIDALNRNAAALQASGGSGTGALVGGPAPQQQAAMLGQQQAAQQASAPVGVTAEQITGLIQPHIANETIKAALGVAMRNLGINALPEAPAHLYGQLYQAFQGVLAQHGVSAAATQQAAATSII